MASNYFECTACGYRGVHAITVGAGNVPPTVVAADDTDRTGEFTCPNCGARQTVGDPPDMSTYLGVSPPLEEPDIPSLGPSTAETIQGSVEAQETAKSGAKGGK